LQYTWGVITLIELPSFFSDGMVIGREARIWGKAEAGEPVEIIFINKRYMATADANGFFETVVCSGGYGGPHTMVVGNRVINNVYIGRVWLCGGQSNMETPISRDRLLLDAHIKDDNRIRVFQGE
jgi:sialate O-acetylesterase